MTDEAIVWTVFNGFLSPFFSIFHHEGYEEHEGWNLPHS